MLRNMQLTLFDKKAPATISIKESASATGVSIATIRNWIKTGYLISSGKGTITIDSLEQFKKEVIGKEKLNRMANKSFKDSHDHKHIISIFLKKIKERTKGYSNIGEDYELSLSDSYRNKEGIYYTPM